MNILEFPEEILVIILGFLPTKERIKCMRVCKTLDRIVRDPLRWNLLIQEKESEGVPDPRLWCSSAIVDDEFFLYGGHVTEAGTNLIESVKSDLFCYNLATQTWTKLDHSLGKKTELKCFVYNHALWFLGGYNGSSYTNEVARYDLIKKESVKLTCTGIPFSPRSAMTSVVWKNYAYVFGGWSGFDGVWFNDMSRLNLDTLHWERVDAIGSAPARTSHVAVLHQNSMYVFAGYSGQKYLADMHQFNFETNTWTEVHTKGRQPEPRSRFCACVNNDTMYLLGGWDKTRHFSSLWTFNFVSQTWAEVEGTDGFVFPPLSQYSMAIYHSKCGHKNPLGGRSFLMVFGGFDTRAGQPVNTMWRFPLPPLPEREEPALVKPPISDVVVPMARRMAVSGSSE